MSKTHGSLQDDPGKNVGSLASKESGSLDKDALTDDGAGYDAPDYDYDSDYSGGSGGYGSSGADGGSGSETTAESDTDSGGTGDSSDYGGDDPSTDTDADGGGDDTLYAESDPDDTGGDETGGDETGGDETGGDDTTGDYTGGPAETEIDGDTEGTKPIQIAPPANKVSIDIEAMIRLVAAMERAREQIETLQSEFRTILGGVMLDTTEASRFDQVAAWIDEELPGLRRRLALAQDLEGDTTPRRGDPHSPPVRLTYVGDENLVADHAPRQSYDNGRQAAERFAVPSEQKPATREIVADLKTGRHDPYFAKEFVHNTQPDDVVRVVLQAASDPDGNPGEHDELVRLTASTLATGSRGIGELAPPEGYEEQWAQLRASDDPETAALAAQLRPARQ